MKVLFIGNSYTYVNDLPSVFVRVCAEHGTEASADLVAAGGYTLAHYVSDANEQAKRLRVLTAENKYDFIVLQEQSVRPASNPETFFKSLEELLKLLEPNGAKPVLYETWGRADGSETLTSNGWTHEAMQERLFSAYSKAAKKYGCILVPAGEAFSKAYRSGTAVFQEDGSHPSPEGTRVAAEAIFEAIKPFVC